MLSPAAIEVSAASHTNDSSGPQADDSNVAERAATLDAILPAPPAVVAAVVTRTVRISGGMTGSRGVSPPVTGRVDAFPGALGNVDPTFRVIEDVVVVKSYISCRLIQKNAYSVPAYGTVGQVCIAGPVQEEA